MLVTANKGLAGYIVRNVARRIDEAHLKRRAAQLAWFQSGWFRLVTRYEQAANALVTRSGPVLPLALERRLWKQQSRAWARASRASARFVEFTDRHKEF